MNTSQTTVASKCKTESSSLEQLPDPILEQMELAVEQVTSMLGVPDLQFACSRKEDLVYSLRVVLGRELEGINLQAYPEVVSLIELNKTLARPDLSKRDRSIYQGQLKEYGRAFIELTGAELKQRACLLSLQTIEENLPSGLLEKMNFEVAIRMRGAEDGWSRLSDSEFGKVRVQLTEAYKMTLRSRYDKWMSFPSSVITWRNKHDIDETRYEQSPHAIEVSLGRLPGIDDQIGEEVIVYCVYGKLRTLYDEETLEAMLQDPERARSLEEINWQCPFIVDTRNLAEEILRESFSHERSAPVETLKPVREADCALPHGIRAAALKALTESNAPMERVNAAVSDFEATLDSFVSDPRALPDFVEKTVRAKAQQKKFPWISLGSLSPERQCEAAMALIATRELLRFAENVWASLRATDEFPEGKVTDIVEASIPNRLRGFLKKNPNYTGIVEHLENVLLPLRLITAARINDDSGLVTSASVELAEAAKTYSIPIHQEEERDAVPPLPAIWDFRTCLSFEDVFRATACAAEPVNPQFVEVSKTIIDLEAALIAGKGEDHGFPLEALAVMVMGDTQSSERMPSEESFGARVESVINDKESAPAVLAESRNTLKAFLSKINKGAFDLEDSKAEVLKEYLDSSAAIQMGRCIAASPLSDAARAADMVKALEKRLHKAATKTLDLNKRIVRRVDAVFQVYTDAALRFLKDEMGEQAEQ